MKVALCSLVATAAALALAPACGPAAGCNSTCPVGCDISPDCSTCVPESAQAGLGIACNTDQDCCTGTCVSGTCTADNLGLGASGSPSGGGSSGSAGTTGGHGTSGGASTGGSSTGAAATCTPSNPPSVASDEQCGNLGALVCSATGTCIANCNVQPQTCATGQICEANGHCENPGTTAGNGSAGNGTAGNGSAGNGSTGTASAGTTTGTSAGTASAGTTTGGSSTGGGTTTGGSAGNTTTTSSGGSTTGSATAGTTSGSSAGCAGSGQEYDNCTTNADCSCPLNCVNSNGSSFCLQPCSSFQQCQTYEICDTTLPVTSCYPNYCSTNPWGACAGGNDTGSSETGTCNVYSDDQGNPYGICFAGGSSAEFSGCNFSPTYSTPAADQCTVGDFCGETASSGSLCFQGCDPTGELQGAPACQHGLSCYSNACDCSSDPDCQCYSFGSYCDPTSDPNPCDPYFGYCE